MIKIIATGNIGKNAEVRAIDSENSVVSFSIASSKKKKDGTFDTTWLNCQKWNSEKLAPYLQKGTKICVVGEMRISEKDGKQYTSCNVHELEFMSKKEESQPQPHVQADFPPVNPAPERTDVPPPTQDDQLPF